MIFLLTHFQCAHILCPSFIPMLGSGQEIQVHAPSDRTNVSHRPMLPIEYASLAHRAHLERIVSGNAADIWPVMTGRKGSKPMLESHIIEIDGTFVGTVIVELDGKTRRFYATHDSVRSFHNRSLSHDDDLTQQVALSFRRTSLSRQLAVEFN